MIVTALTKDYINSIILPDRVKGQYWLYDSSETDRHKMLSIEGIGSHWLLKSGKNASVLNADGQPVSQAELAPLNIYMVKQQQGENAVVFTEPASEDRQYFIKFFIQEPVRISIGRTMQNDICYSNAFVSSVHAELSLENGQWSITDQNSMNGTYVNDKRVKSTAVSVGDTVYIMGLKVLLGKSYIAINNPDGQVQVSQKLIPFVMQEKASETDEETYELPERELFFRLPRFKRDIETASFQIDSPPSSPISEEMPWVLVMGSSMAMGVMSLTTLINSLVNKNIMSMVMGGSMLAGTVLLPTITKKYETRRKARKEQLRQRKYREYLDKITVRMNEECISQENILRENYVSVQECEKRIIDEKQNLWERGFGQNDFLKLRVGTGNLPMDAELKYGERRFTLDDDNLQEELYILAENKKELRNVPIVYSLYDYSISAVAGNKRYVSDLAKSFLIQLSALYGYDELKLVVLYSEQDEKEYEFVKWLPHVWSNDRSIRLIATNTNEAKEVSSYLENIVSERLEMNETDAKEVMPYYIIFALNQDLALRTDALKQVLSAKQRINISVITLYGDMRTLPKESSMVVELEDGKGRLFDKSEISGRSIEFVPELKLTKDPMVLSKKLANVTLDTVTSRNRLPEAISFLEMFGVGKVEHLNSLTRWKENDPSMSLEAAVGVNTLGDTFFLDLHEKNHGPHGLVAGMTGSGKSEFVITYILSLAVNYHPDEVAFILIDYKGGGMAKSFEKLPHTAGIITNLDGAAIKRSLVSIESELKRRQAIFAEVSKQVDISNIDIYKYQKLYREGVVKEPLQHLFIISDEFAELKTQQPEFMAQLVSAARIGRSLGVHLILATQKPSGVVDDQIWSNSKFRICLKVQERADSMDMLKRADAAELTTTGRFYLQVGYNELFEMGQSAWAGAPYYPSDYVQKEKDNSVEVINRNGQVIKSVKLDKRRQQYANARKQLDVITEYLQQIANEEGVKVRPLWLPPIPPVIVLDRLRKKYSGNAERFILNPLIGEYDDPVHQRQCELRLPISEEGNAVVYGAAESGKTTFINAVIYSLIKEHTPEEVSLYILDFASETLKAYSSAPHVGDVMFSYEGEKLTNLFKMLGKELKNRKKLFSDYGGDYASYIRTSGHTLPSIVVVVNNYAALMEEYENLDEAVAYMSREGTKYGIYFVLTAISTGTIRFRMLQNFKQLFVLQLNDETEYATIVGKTDGLYPSKYKGRGLFKRDAVYEFQTAQITEDGSPYQEIQSYCEAYREAWTGETARRVPVLPEAVSMEFIRDYIDKNRPMELPIGVNTNSLQVYYYPFGKSYVNLILSTDNEYQYFAEQLAALMSDEYKLSGYILDSQDTMSEEYSGFVRASTIKTCEDMVVEIFELVRNRNNAYKDAIQAGTQPENYEQKVVLIPGLDLLKSNLSEKGQEMLSLILEKGSVNYHLTIIICEQAKQLGMAVYEKWYKQHVSSGDGIWVGSGFTEQYQMKANKMTSDLQGDLTPDYGIALQNGKGVKLKLLGERLEESEYES